VIDYDFGPRREPVTAEEEIELARRIANGDASARDELVERTFFLINPVARKYVGRGLPLEDLIAEGALGLVKAAQEFDAGRGSFGTYAQWHIAKAIKQAFARNPVIMVTAPSRHLLRAANLARRELAQTLGRPPLFDELIAQMGLSPIRRRTLWRALLASKARLETDALSEAGMSDVPDPQSLVADDEERQALHVDLAAVDLTAKERTVLTLIYGLDGDSQPVPPSKIAKRIKRTRQTVRIYQLQALKKIREALTPADDEAVSA
jgi:RNA polymerase primary sigma factor